MLRAHQHEGRLGLYQGHHGAPRKSILGKAKRVGPPQRGEETSATRIEKRQPNFTTPGLTLGFKITQGLEYAQFCCVN